MHEFRLLFDAMDQDWLITVYVTAATCFTVIVLVQLAQLAWHYLEPHVFLLLNFREESSREVSSEMSPASSRMAATALRTQVRRDVRQRFKSRVAERGCQVGAAHASRMEQKWLASTKPFAWSEIPADRQAQHPDGDAA